MHKNHTPIFLDMTLQKKQKSKMIIKQNTMTNAH
jgi:hypothetical protein